jgi:hypothetical protein
MPIRRSLAFALILAVTVVGAVAATHTSIGLSSSLLGRGSWDRSMLGEFASELGDVHRYGESTVAVVRASLAANGTTDWHGHPGPSVVVVTAGTLRVIEPAPGGGCIQHDYQAGDAFFHAEGAHTFVNPSSTVQADFLVTYFAPAGPLLTHDAATC